MILNNYLFANFVKYTNLRKMNITQLAQKVAGLTLMVQNMISAAKRILELPTQETLVPASYIHVSNNGVSQKLEIQKIINAIANLNYNRLISIGIIEIVGNDLKIPAFAQWLINNIVVGNNAEVTIPIPFAEEGLNRTDLIYGNEDGEILRLPGPELAGIFLKPNLPPNCVEITTLNVTDSTIGDPSTPIIGENFVKKENFGEVILNSSGVTTLVLQASVGGVRFQGSNTSFESINIIDIQNLWIGKPFDIINDQTNEQTLKHLTGIGNQFSFPDKQDYLMQPGERSPFRWNLTSANVWVMEYVGPYPNYTPQKTITGNVTLDNSFNGKIVKIKANATITIPTTLKKDFSCVFRTFMGATGTFAGGVGSTVDAQKGTILEPFKMATLFKDGNAAYFVLEGELKT